jgi:hypothetical protein
VNSKPNPGNFAPQSVSRLARQYDFVSAPMDLSFPPLFLCCLNRRLRFANACSWFDGRDVLIVKVDRPMIRR